MFKESILKFLKLEGVIANITGYIEARVELMKWEVKEDIAKTIAKAAVIIVLSFVFTLFILFISMAVAYKIGDSVGYFSGFAIVAGFYLLVALVLWLSRDAIRRKLEHQLMENLKTKKK